MSRRLCLASCYLPPTADQLRWWEELRDALDRRGFDLVLLSGVAWDLPGVRSLVLPMWLNQFAESFPALAREPAESEWADALAWRDCAWLRAGAGIEEHRRGVGAAENLLRSVLQLLEPAAVLTWGNSLGVSAILQRVARDGGWPCWVLERGFIPETLMLEIAGQGGESELNTSFTLGRALASSVDEERFFTAQRQYLEQRTTKYPQGDYLPPAEFRARYLPDQARAVALLLQHEHASALTPRAFRGTRLHAPGIGLGIDAVPALEQALAAHPGTRLLIKPHPMDPGDYTRFNSPRVEVVGGANLHSLLENAEVVVAMTSTTQFEALLHEKPLVLLARSALAGKGAAYEALRAQDVPAAVGAALRREDHSRRQRAARRFLGFVLRHGGIRLSPESPGGASLGDLAEFIAGASPWATTETPFPDRWNELQALIARGGTEAPVTAPVLVAESVTGPAAADPIADARERAEAHFDAGEWAEAARVFAGLAARLPDDLGICLRRIECSRRQGRDAIAALLTTKALEQHPEWRDVLDRPVRR